MQLQVMMIFCLISELKAVSNALNSLMNLKNFDFKVLSWTMSLMYVFTASDILYLPNKSMLRDGGVKCDKLFSMLCCK